MSYTKLFSSIVTSTIWTEDAKTCKVWVTMLAIANKHGEVQASIPGLAQIAGLPLTDTEAAVEKFLSPDKYSRTPDDQGRRIEKIDGGWLLLNHAKYRAMASKDEEKASSAKRQSAFRERQKRNARVTPSNGSVTVSNDTVTGNGDIAEAEAEAEADPLVKNTKRRNRGTEEEVKAYAISQGMPESDGEACFLKWEGNGWTNKGEPVKCWKSTFRNWKLQRFLPSQKATAEKPGSSQAYLSSVNGYNERTDF